MTNQTTKTQAGGAVELTETDLINAQGARIKMKPVYITSYQTGGSSGDVLPSEEVTFNFTKIGVRT